MPRLSSRTPDAVERVAGSGVERVAGSGAEAALTYPWTVDWPGTAPEFGATIPVNTVVLNSVNPKLPLKLFSVTGPSCSGDQVIVRLLALL